MSNIYSITEEVKEVVSSLKSVLVDDFLLLDDSLEEELNGVLEDLVDDIMNIVSPCIEDLELDLQTAEDKMEELKVEVNVLEYELEEAKLDGEMK